MTEFQLLGKVTVLVDGHPLDPGPDKQRCVLAALAVDVGRVVSVERLAERVWGDDPPLRARATLASYLSRLRRLLAVAADADVVRLTGGYALQADASVVDLHRFRSLCAQAKACDDRSAAGLLTEALDVWQGEAMTGLGGDWAAAERGRLHQERLIAECDLADALLRLGHGGELLVDLAARIVAWPLDERVAASTCWPCTAWGAPPTHWPTTTKSGTA